MASCIYCIWYAPVIPVTLTTSSWDRSLTTSLLWDKWMVGFTYTQFITSWLACLWQQFDLLLNKFFKRDIFHFFPCDSLLQATHLVLSWILPSIYVTYQPQDPLLLEHVSSRERCYQGHIIPVTAVGVRRPEIPNRHTWPKEISATRSQFSKP